MLAPIAMVGFRSSKAAIAVKRLVDHASAQERLHCRGMHRPGCDGVPQSEQAGVQVVPQFSTVLQLSDEPFLWFAELHAVGFLSFEELARDTFDGARRGPLQCLSKHA